MDCSFITKWTPLSDRNKSINQFKYNPKRVPICSIYTSPLQSRYRGNSPSKGAFGVDIPWIWGADRVEIPFVMGTNSHSILIVV